MAGKVGNLRAMFEQKGETSPPERGRSPGVLSSGTESPRPLSKVRTSFVAIEKDGRIGLQRDTSVDSDISARIRRTSGGEADASIFPEGSSSSLDNKEIKPIKTSLREQPIPESPRVDNGDAFTSLPPPTNTPVSSPPETSPVKTSPAKESEPKAVPTPPNTTKASPAKSTTLNAVSAKAGVPKSATMEDKSSNVKTAARGSSLQPAAKTNGTIHPKSNGVTPATAAKHPKPTATHAKALAESPMAASSSSTQKKPPPLQASPSSGVGFVKPKVKSPTRPVKLPAGLTTHTAASGSKARNGASAEPSQRSHSRVAAATAPRPLRRQNSTISPRPSVGPPPKQSPAKDHPPRKEKEVDEGFLARMMRPTQASASKVREGVPTTPPRKAPAPKVAVFHSHQPQPVKMAAAVAKRPESAATTTTTTTAADVAEPTTPPAEQMAESVSVDKDPIAKRVTESTPIDTEPATEKIAASLLVNEEPTVEKVAETAPASEKPTAEEPTAEEPTAEEPTAEELGHDESAGEEQAAEDVNPEKPLLDQQAEVVSTPTSGKSTVDEAALEELEKATAQLSLDEKPAAQETSVETRVSDVDSTADEKIADKNPTSPDHMDAAEDARAAESTS